MVTDVPLIWSGGNTASTIPCAQRFGGAKRLLVELDRGIGIVDDEMRRDGLHGVGHFLNSLVF
jgi:hypothetical protein